jgi:hypothetical protein
MINLLKKYCWSFWLGLSLAIAGITADNWKFWYISIPTVILVIWRGYSEKLRTDEDFNKRWGKLKQKS